jgi:hypothetical protein
MTAGQAPEMLTLGVCSRRPHSRNTPESEESRLPKPSRAAPRRTSMQPSR